MEVNDDLISIARLFLKCLDLSQIQPPLYVVSEVFSVDIEFRFFNFDPHKTITD